jgi:hypothetical protein
MSVKMLLGLVLFVMVGYFGRIGASLICTTATLTEVTSTHPSNGTTVLDRQLMEEAKGAILPHLKRGASFSQENSLDGDTSVIRYPGTETYLVQGTVPQPGGPMVYAVVISTTGAKDEAYYLMLNGTGFGDHLRLRHDVDIEKQAWKPAASERKGTI